LAVSIGDASAKKIVHSVVVRLGYRHPLRFEWHWQPPNRVSQFKTRLAPQELAMPANDPNFPVDRLVGEPDQDPAAKADRSRRDSSADAITAAAQNTRPYESVGTADSAQPSSIVPVIPYFEIDGKLGHGGMGVVFCARQTSLNWPVGIKRHLVANMRAPWPRHVSSSMARSSTIQHPCVAHVQHLTILRVRS
jgi:hypothetical protein